MKNTGKQLLMSSYRYNWNFGRTIWIDNNGNEYVRVNGLDIPLEEAKSDCDSWSIVH